MACESLGKISECKVRVSALLACEEDHAVSEACSVWLLAVVGADVSRVITVSLNGLIQAVMEAKVSVGAPACDEVRIQGYC